MGDPARVHNSHGPRASTCRTDGGPYGPAITLVHGPVGNTLADECREFFEFAIAHCVQYRPPTPTEDLVPQRLEILEALPEFDQLSSRNVDEAGFAESPCYGLLMPPPVDFDCPELRIVLEVVATYMLLRRRQEDIVDRAILDPDEPAWLEDPSNLREVRCQRVEMMD